MTMVLIDDLKPGMTTAQDIMPPRHGTVAYVRKNTLLTAAMISDIRRLGVRSVYVKDPESVPPLVMGVAPEIPPEPVREVRKGREFREVPTLPVIAKAKPTISDELRDEAVTTLRDVFDFVRINEGDVHASARVVKQVDSVVDNLVKEIQSNSSMLVNIGDLKSYDEYTFHHSLSVAVVSLAMGQHLGFSHDGMHRLGMCAMMHDIGKTAVPIELIHKTSRLDNEEFATIKNHAPAGYEYLMRNGIGDEGIWRGVLYHHEKMDGTGYPHGLGGKAIPVMSRIISVADVYDALTSNRPYRTPMQPSEALEYLMGGVDSSFDFNMVEAFMKRLDLYPIGSQVLLSNGIRATVLQNDNQPRPVVRLDTGEIVDMFRDRQYLSVVITTLLPD